MRPQAATEPHTDGAALLLREVHGLDLATDDCLRCKDFLDARFELFSTRQHGSVAFLLCAVSHWLAALQV